MSRGAAAVAAAALIAYLPSLGGAFQFDDYNVIVDFPRVHSWQALWGGLAEGLRPVLQASYALNWTLDQRPLGFLAVNIALHALNAALLFLIGRRLFAKDEPAVLVAALLFALHPAQTEAVTYISGRSVSLMATFYLGALLLHLQERRWWSCLAFIAALATRETAVTLPAALLLADAVRGRIDWRRQAPHWLILAAAALVFLVAPRYHELLVHGYSQRGLAENLLTQVGGVSYLVSRLVALHGYNIDPALPTLAQIDGLRAFEAAMLLALLCLGLVSLRTRSWLAFGVLWFFLQLAPTNSIVPRLDVANERQLYLASWGLFLALSMQIARIGLPFKALRAAAIAALLICAAASVARQLDYADEITLWESSVRESPWNARARNNLGYAYYAAGRKADARREMETALLFDPGYLKARANLRLLDWK